MYLPTQRRLLKRPCSVWRTCERLCLQHLLQLNTNQEIGYLPGV